MNNWYKFSYCFVGLLDNLSFWIYYRQVIEFYSNTWLFFLEFIQQCISLKLISFFITRNIFFCMKISNCEIEIFYKIMSNRFDSFPYSSRRELNFFLTRRDKIWFKDFHAFYAKRRFRWLSCYLHEMIGRGRFELYSWKVRTHSDVLLALWVVKA